MMTQPAQALPTVADFIIRALQEEGVTDIFGYPGGAALHLYDALSRTHRIRHIMARHEQGAVHAADGYSRSSHKTGVCLVTSGPGVTNAITGIATAYMDSVPMVVITAQTPLCRLGTDSFQEVDTLGITRSCVKHGFLLTGSDDVEATIKKAFHLATTGRPGPVVIDVPKDVSGMPVGREFDYPLGVSIRGYRWRFPLPRRQLARAAETIRSARRPLICYGGGVVLGRASQDLLNLAGQLGAPVTSTLMGLGAFPASHPQFLGMLGTHGTYEANLAMQHCDVLIAVGARFDDCVIANPEEFDRGCRQIVHIDIDPCSVSKRVVVDVPLIGDCAELLRELVALLQAMPLHHYPFPQWVSDIEGWRRTRCLDYAQGGELSKPQEVIELLSSHDDSTGSLIVTSDAGQHQLWAAQYFKFAKPRKWICSGGLGAMGFGLPAAMGAAVANPAAQVVCITGDAGIQMCSKELSTCLQYRLPIKILCLNNRGLGMVRHEQDIFHGSRRYGSYMESVPDFVALARAYGHEGIRVGAAGDLPGILREVLAERHRLILVDIPIDRSEKVYPTPPADSGLTERPCSPELVSEAL